MLKILQVILIAIVAAILWPVASQAQSRVGGASSFHLVAAASNNSTSIATGNHVVYSVELGGIGAAPAYLKFYDKASAPTCGTDTPIKTLIIPAAATAANGAASNTAMPLGLQVKLGLGICVTAGIADSDNTSVAATTFIVNIDYF